MAKKILIIDDDITFQKAISMKLESLKYDVIGSIDSEDGFNKAILEKPDLILLDIIMPKMNGIEFLKKFREHNKGLSNTPVLITSNTSTLDNISEGVTLGVKGYIVKSNENLDNIAEEVRMIFEENK